MKFNKYKLFSLGLLVGILFGGFLVFNQVWAQPDLGIQQVGEALDMPNTDIRTIIANIIKVALSLLGVVALVLILYGGFVWMTAGGNADKVEQAKKILVNAVIGLAIILSAYAIVSFVMSKLIQATSDYPSHCYNDIMDSGEEGLDCGGECSPCGGGIIPPGAGNVFYVQQKPSGDVCVRNFYPIVVFNRPINLSSITGNLVVRRTSDQTIPAGTWEYLSLSAQNAIKFSPSGDCGDGTNDCLDPDTNYELVFITPGGILSQDSLTLSCSLGVGCNSTDFTTGNGIDRTPPTVIIDYPDDGARLEKGMDVVTDVVFTDDNGVQNISLYADGGFVSSQSIAGCVQTGRVQISWPTQNVSLGNHTLRAVGWDYSAAEDDDSVVVNIQPTHCFNGVMDEDETNIDCGGACGSCGGESCTLNEQCASGYCEIPTGETEGICVDRMQITNISPLSGAPETYVTISGRFFGNDGGRVYFTSAAGGWIEAPIVNCGSGYDNWTDAQIVVSVPEGATDGPLRVDTGIIVGKDGVERQFTDTTNDDWGPNFIFDLNDLVRPGICILDPTSGPPYSTTVQLMGKNFGDSVDDLLNDNVWFGDLKSLINVWSDELVRVKVPGLGTGSVAVIAENNGIKGNGLRFFVSDDIGAGAPVIFSISPSQGARGEYVTITGDNFGNTLGKVVLKERNLNNNFSLEGSFDFPEDCKDSVWSNTQIIFKIPTGVDLNRDYSIQVQLPSAPYQLSPIGAYFTTEAGAPSPGLCRIDPISGPIPFAADKDMKFYGEYFTNDNVSVPYFWSLNADVNTITGRVRTTEFVSWTDMNLVIRPPVGAITGPTVVSRTTDNKISNPLSFSVFDCVKNNNKCTTDGYKCCTLGEDAGVCRPEGELCSGQTRSTGYMWRFSTRDFPLVPRVLESCNGDTDLGNNLPSPSPSLQWNAGNNDHSSVCRTALVTVGFTAPVTQSSVNAGTVHVYKCGVDSNGEGGVTNNACLTGTRTEITMSPDSYDLLNFSNGTNNNFYLSMLPGSGTWEDNSWYQVVLDDQIESEIVAEEGNYTLKADRPCGAGTAYCFVFRSDSSECQIKRIVITPFSYWTSILEEPVKFRIIKNNANDAGTDLQYSANGLSTQHCIWMDTSGFNWSWNSDNINYSRIYSVDATHPNRAQVTAVANTVGVGLANDSVGIRATATRAGSSYSTSSPLTIDLSNPDVADYWPNCLEACPNAEVGLRFNLAMSNQNLSQGVRLYSCTNENCLATIPVAITPVVNPADRREISFTPAGGLIRDQLYQVVISSETDPARQLWTMGNANDLSVLGKAYQKEFTWRFRAKAEACVLDRVSVVPKVFYAPYITARTIFSVNAYSSPDQCRATGQRLDAWSLNWNWSSAVTDIARVATFSTKGKSQFCTANCLLNGSDIPASGVVNEPVCGNGVLEAGEDCDNPSNATNCSLNCLLTTKTNTGSLPQTEATDVNASICGNGMIGIGEDCDLGITPNKAVANSSMNCSETCLHTGSRLSASWCGANKATFGGFDYVDYEAACAKSFSKCGDGIVAPNEDAACEVGVYDSTRCTENCLLIEECAPFDSNGRVEGCSLDRKYMGSSLLYSTPSSCGDNVTAIGEHPACEATVPNQHTFMDPWVLVIGVGRGTLNGNPPSQNTSIFARVSNTQISASGNFIIQCGFTSDDECSQNVAYCGPQGCGVADNSCCYPRPAVLGTYPASTTPPAANVCLNTYVEVAFDKKIDPLSLSGNIFLARGSSASQCAEGEDITHLLSLNSNGQKLPWYKNVWHKALAVVKNVKKLLVNVGFVQAQTYKTNLSSDSWCAGLDLNTAEIVYEPLNPGQEEIDTVSRVMIKLQQPLDDSSDYAVVLRPGIRDIRGVSIGSKVKWKFITGSKVCLIDSLSINPSEYLFDQVDEATNLQAIPKTYDDKIIQPVLGYSWNYLWGPENNDYIILNTTTPSVVLATTKNRNGEMDMMSVVKFTENIFSDTNPEFSASTKLTTFICENPWPGIPGWTAFSDSNYDFSTYYCMDAGTFGTSDDLPNLKFTVRSAGSGVTGLETGVLRKYIFSTKDVSDAIGISIITNPDKQSVYKLLSLAGFSNYQKLKVKGFDAISDTYNIYVDAAIQGSGGTIYSNIYLFSLNQNSGPEMRNIFEQMLSNLNFNLFADNVKYCGVRPTGSTLPNFERPCESDLECAFFKDTPVCLNIKDKITRNYSRFKDLRDVKQTMEDYRVETGNASYPLMSQNTYLAGQAVSIWPNAWNELSSQVGVLPVDPINKLRSSGTCYLTTNRACVSDDDCGTVPAVDSLRSLWLADNNTKDEQGLSDGVIVGSVNYTSAKGIGNAFEFNGEAESYVDISHKDLYNSKNLSFSFWFKPTKQAPAMLIKKGGLSGDNKSLGGFEIEYSGLSFASGSSVHNNGTIRFAVYRQSDTPSYYAVDTGTPLELNKWHHIYVNYNFGGMSLYVDNVANSQKRDQDLRTVGNISDFMYTNNESIKIGSSLNGAIDNIYYYDSALPQSYIAGLYNHLCVLHDETTGWSTEDFRFSFACNTDSYAYRYVYNNATKDYSLRANLENDGFLVNSTFVRQDTKIVYDNYGVCLSTDEVSSPNSLVCGDGIVGSGETCDPPGAEAWDTSGCPTSRATKRVCSNSCNWTTVVSTGSVAATCRAAAGGSCGDGKIQYLAGERCDDGDLNGQIWRCKDDCSGIENTKCGNGVLDTNAGELCDPTVGKNNRQGWCVGGPYTFDPSNVAATFVSCNRDSDCTTNQCYITNVKYSIDRDSSCNWDCKSRGPYCGDEKTQGEWAEDCDGDLPCTLSDGRDGQFSCLSTCRKDNSGGSRDMLALWEFDSIGPNGEVYDTIGNYDGSCKPGECPDIVEGKHEGNPAFDFMGQTRLVTINDKNDKTMSTPPFSWEMWYKPELNPGVSDPRLLEKGGRDSGFGTSGATGRVGGVQILVNPTGYGVAFMTRYFLLNREAGSTYTTAPAYIGEWQHLIGSFEPTSVYTPSGLPSGHECYNGIIYMYVNGNLVNTQTNARICNTNYPLCFGVKCNIDGNVDFGNYTTAFSYKGAIEDIAFYDKLIDQETIGDHARSSGWYCTAFPDDYYEDDPNSSVYAPYCGNGILDEDEVCDVGENNGVPCSPTVGARCGYCAYDCDSVLTMERY